MLYQPTNISPSMLGPLGNGVVDANEDFIVSWQVNGNSPMTAFEVQIYTNDSEPVEIYDSGKLTDGCPFYGTDYAGNQNMFSCKINAALENGTNYKLIITQWWSGTDFVRQQSASAFITRSTPSVTFTESIGGYDPGSITFRAKYTQEQGDTLNWVRWQIASVPEGWSYGDDVADVVADTGNIFGTSQLQYTFDGALPDRNYAVRCMVQTENGDEADTEWNDFFTIDPEPIDDASIHVCADAKSGSIRLTLPDATDIPPRDTWGEFEIADSELRLEKYANVFWGGVENPVAHAPLIFAYGGSNGILGTHPITLVLGESESDFNGSLVQFSFEHADATEEGIYPISGTGTWRTVVYKKRNGGLYMALGDAGVAYSSDAKTWTMSTIPAALSQNVSSLLLCGKYGNSSNLFFLASSATSTAAYSEDGVTWTTVTLKEKVTGVASGEYGNYFYASYADGTIYRTRDFNRWYEVPINGYTGKSPISGIEYSDDDVAVLLREDGMRAYSADFGDTWTLTYAGRTDSGYKCYGLCYGNGTFFYRDSNGVRYTSKDGISWGNASGGSAFGSATGNNTVFGGGLFLIGGNGNVVMSADGVDWYIPASTASGNLLCGCYDGNKFVFVGSGGNATIIDTCKPFKLLFDDTEVCSGNIYAERWIGLAVDGTTFYYSEDFSEPVKTIPAAIPFSEKPFLQSIELRGEQACNSIAVTTGTDYSESRINDLMRGYPVQDADDPLQFYTNFSNGLNGGQYGVTGCGKFAVYRKDGNKESFHHVGDISVEEGSVLIDASAAHGAESTYYAYGVGYAYTGAVVSDPVHVCGWDWYLMACTQDDAGAYHVQKLYRFSNNLSSGSVSNNAGPSVLQNFTRYPTVQNSPWNYRSGTLTSLIGYTADGKYYDTKELRDEITALTTSDYALFLKNRKGDVIRIAVSGAIEMETMDNSASQAQTMKLPWTEIGDASDAQIVITKNDGAYLQSIPSPVVGGYCDCGGGASRSFAYPLTVLQSSGTTVYDGSESKKIVIKGDGGSGEVVAEDDGNGNITIY